MKTSTLTDKKRYEMRLPNGKVIHSSKPFRTVGPENRAEIEQYFAEWRERNKHLLEGYSVAQFLKEKYEDVEKGLL